MGDFADSISHSDSLQLIGVIANCSGILSSALGVISFVQSEEEPDNAELLDKIDQLQQTIDTDFAKLGDLIQQQTQIIVDTVNRDGMALALSRSDVATARIQTFLANGDNNALETAETESIAGVQFFNELGLSSYADMLFFLPGLVKAGSVRIFVIASEPLRVREPKNVIVDSIGSMVTLLANMIETIKSTVDAAHTVNEKSHTARCPVHQPIHGSAPVREVTVIDGYYHEERGQIARRDRKRAGEFRMHAQLSGGVPGPVISVDSPFISIDMSAYGRPTATGMIVDGSDIKISFPDVNTFTGKLQLPDIIHWSNHTAWTKVKVNRPVVSEPSAAH